MNNPFDIMKQLGSLKGQIDSLKDNLKNTRVEGAAGGGMVKAILNGEFCVESLEISQELMDLGDKGTIEVMVSSAINDAVSNVRKKIEEDGLKVAGGMGLNL